jgi:hypothetical protein
LISFFLSPFRKKGRPDAAVLCRQTAVRLTAQPGCGTCPPPWLASAPPNRSGSLDELIHALADSGLPEPALAGLTGDLRSVARLLGRRPDEVEGTYRQIRAAVEDAPHRKGGITRKTKRTSAPRSAGPSLWAAGSTARRCRAVAGLGRGQAPPALQVRAVVARAVHETLLRARYLVREDVTDAVLEILLC